MPMRTCPNVGRRRFWQRVMLGGLALAIGLRSGKGQAQPSTNAPSYKMTKKQAGYIDRHGPATQICAQCIYFIAPNDCVIVQGPVSPTGWCNYYGD